jgi:PiT family inorganic phosphate transporter
LVSFQTFLGTVGSNPFLALVMVLVLAIIFVNGATDAANAIAEPVGTRAINVDSAIVMSVIANFIGLTGMSLISTAVADTMSGMVDFGGDNHAALVALAAAAVAIVSWASIAWVFGIPTSESHALIAGLTGAALAVHGDLGGVNWGEWVKVIYGLVLSTVGGFAAGWLIARVIPPICKNMDRRRTNRFFRKMQVASAFGAATMHGAQDGQKFMSTAMMAIALSAGMKATGLSYPLWIEVICALMMAIGTGVGGKRIIKKVGMDMVQLEQYQGFAAALASVIALCLATFTGLPVSTTHTSSSAMMGAGAAKSLHSVDWGVAKEMVYTWIFTFPGCGLLGYLMALLFLTIF